MPRVRARENAKCYLSSKGDMLFQKTKKRVCWNPRLLGQGALMKVQSKGGGTVLKTRTHPSLVSWLKVCVHQVLGMP